MENKKIDFKFFVTSLGMQASIAMGHFPNPLTGQKQVHLTQAKVLLDTLDLLKEKTVNNLTSEEELFLDNLLKELKNAYASISEKEADND